MRLGIFAGLGVLCVLVPAMARAEGPRFGGPGQLAITDDQPIGAVGATNFISPVPPGSNSTVSFEFASVSGGGGSGTALALSPAMDYFVIRNLSVGASALFGVLSPAHPKGSPDETLTLFGIAPRVGFNVPFTDTVSWWPKAYFGYTTASASSSGPSNGQNEMAIGIYAPFMFQPSPHFILGIGPNFSTQLSNNATSGDASVSQPKITEVGIQATVGGWCLGD
jgi:hypothetical protein